MAVKSTRANWDAPKEWSRKSANQNPNPLLDPKKTIFQAHQQYSNISRRFDFIFTRFEAEINKFSSSQMKLHQNTISDGTPALMLTLTMLIRFDMIRSDYECFMLNRWAITCFCLLCIGVSININAGSIVFREYFCFSLCFCCCWGCCYFFFVIASSMRWILSSVSRQNHKRCDLSLTLRYLILLVGQQSIIAFDFRMTFDVRSTSETIKNWLAVIVSSENDRKRKFRINF